MKPFIIFGKKCPITKANILEKHGAVGLFYPDEFRIEIEEKLGAEEELITLLHELGHALFERASLNQANISPDVKEIIVDVYAKVLIENFKLRRK